MAASSRIASLLLQYVAWPAWRSGYLGNLLAQRGLPTITSMGYQALLFCADEKTVRAVTQVLNELEFGVECSSEPFAAVKRLTAQHFDALVVDCEDEQNAALLFKAARNSTVNNTSLLVAVVQGQAGIAKAFRLGANLVLTKPINVEQSKGTLRVARGLLRKEAGKAAAAAAAMASTATQGQTGIASEELQSPLLLPAAGETSGSSDGATTDAKPAIDAATVTELQADLGPQPNAEEAAVLESLPAPLLAKDTTTADSDPVPATPAAELESKTESQDSTADGSAKVAEKSPAISGRSEVSQLSLAVAEVKGSRRGDGPKSSSGAAAAVAPAKEIPPPVQDPSTTKEVSTKASETKPVDAKKGQAKQPLSAGKKAAASTAQNKGSADFSWLEAAREQDAQSSPHNKRNFFIAAVLVLCLASAAYYAWPKLEPLLMSFPLVQKYLGTAVPPPAPPISSSAHSAGAANGSAGSSTSTTALGGTAAATSSPASDSSTGAATSSLPAGATSAAPGGMAKPADASIAGGVSPSSQPLTIPSAVSESLVTKRTEPVYPSVARQSKVAGKVQLLASVGKDGSVTQVKALSGDPRLVPAAEDAVRQWKYKPYAVNGQPVAFDTEVTVTFTPPTNPINH
jgi:periplasmic protein TonB